MKALANWSECWSESGITAKRICQMVVGQSIAILAGLAVYRISQEVTVAILAAVLMGRIMLIVGL